MKSSDSRRVHVQRINRVPVLRNSHPKTSSKIARFGKTFSRTPVMIVALDRTGNYLFQAWLPSGDDEPAHEPAMEVYRGHPLKIGCEVFDSDCLVPVKTLSARGALNSHSGPK